MSTNYYWKELMPELREIAEFKHCDLTYVGPLIHIGHSAYAGEYCSRCGTTLITGGSRYLHCSYSDVRREDDIVLLDACPVCGKEDMITSSYSFSITIWKHLDILKSRDPGEILVVDEYNSFLTVGEMLDIINGAQAIFQDPRIWS
jgi:hypothetical protein